MKFNYFGLVLGMALKFYTNVPKGLELEVKKFYGITLTFQEVTEEKPVVAAFLHSTPKSTPKLYQNF